MFKIIVLLGVAFGLASAQLQAQLSPNHPHFSQVLRGNSVNDERGQFNYGYETSHGIRNDANGYVKNPEASPEDRILHIGGSYAYYTPDGALHEVTYTADENGFKPVIKVTQG
ncbi:unnamed protein product [Allacma fusca]|uniref:Uncharacterized protein n=1 Tax=Allacma fusca TaxID=39272 RepID=A0A8J2IZ35_9HEXA|nr:unnamed protein product [Allacma fusca]